MAWPQQLSVVKDKKRGRKSSLLITVKFQALMRLSTSV